MSQSWDANGSPIPMPTGGSGQVLMNGSGQWVNITSGQGIAITTNGTNHRIEISAKGSVELEEVDTPEAAYNRAMSIVGKR